MAGSRSTSVARSLLRSNASNGSRRSHAIPRCVGSIYSSGAAGGPSTSIASFSHNSLATSSSLRLSKTNSDSTDRLLHTSSLRNRPSRKGDHREEAEGSREEAAQPTFNARLTPKAAESVESIQNWLRAAFPGLPFPDDVALQLVTHESWDHGVSAGHSRRLGFMGRRALKFFLSLFLATHGRGQVALTTNRIEELLHTSKLGDNVGRSLRLEEVMRWTPAVNDGQQGARETGLYKIRGVCVEALVGAIYHQHGARVAKAFFAGRILPRMGTFTDAESKLLGDALAREARDGETLLTSMMEEASGGQHGVESRQEQVTATKVDLAAAPSITDTSVASSQVPDEIFERGPVGVPSSPTSSTPMRRRSKPSGAPSTAVSLDEEARPAQGYEGMALG